MEKEGLETLFRDHGFSDFKWISARDIVVAQWVRYRCMFGCPNYGKSATCPPNVPPVEDCRRMMSEYSHAVVFHFEKEVEKPQDRKPWRRIPSKDSQSWKDRYSFPATTKQYSSPLIRAVFARNAQEAGTNAKIRK
jgi:predicted metal-binding protein